MNYYDVLGVDRDASLEQIKFAFRTKAKETHPDRNPDVPNANEKFNIIATAYAVLSDPIAREKYDQGLDINYEDTEISVYEIELFIAMMKKELAPYKKAAMGKMISGLIWLAIGVFVSISSYTDAVNSPEGGTAVIMWGAIIFGFIKAAKGYSAYTEIMNVVKEVEDEIWLKL